MAEHNNKKTGIDFKITSTKHYVSVVTLYKNDNSKSLENLKQGFKRTVSWNKYKFEINNKTKKQQFVLYDWSKGILIGSLFFQAKQVKMILQKVLLVSITFR